MINFAIASRRNRLARPLFAAAAALLLASALPNTASAQTMGYAAAPQAGPFGADDEVLGAPPAAEPDAAVSDEDAQLSDRLRRQVVRYDGNQPAGTIVIDTSNTYLYYVLGDGRAIRYGVGVGREGFTWAGTQTITRKAEWPDWHPPAQMIARQPYLPRFMAGGPGNPLGARALYLGATVYRIHGTNAPQTIGTAVSSGCFRLVNADVTDLYDRVPVGTKVIIRQKPEI